MPALPPFRFPPRPPRRAGTPTPTRTPTGTPTPTPAPAATATPPAPAAGRCPRPPLLRRMPPSAWLAVVWCVAGMWLLAGQGSGPHRVGPPLWAPAHTLTALTTAALCMLPGSLLVRRRPTAGLGALLVGAMVMTAALGLHTFPYLAFLPAVATVGYVAARRARAWSVPAALGAGFLMAASSLAQTPQQRMNPLVIALSSLVAWLVGDSVRQSRAHAETVRAQAAEQAVTAERLRIAREVHDMIAHSVGVIAIQAGMGSRVIGTQPEQAGAALRTIELTSRETLASLRRTLTALRRAAPSEPGGLAGLAGPGKPGGRGGPAGGPELAPAPGLADLDRLTAATADAGVRVALRVLGSPRPLPADLDLAAYRIVQESLTNVLRHAPARDCEVTVRYGDGELGLTVHNGPDEADRWAPGATGGHGGVRTSPGTYAMSGGGPGRSHRPGASATGPAARAAHRDGFGIAGMRERTALLHGRFAAGPLPGGGFRVEAALPLPPAVGGVA